MREDEKTFDFFELHLLFSLCCLRMQVYGDEGTVRYLGEVHYGKKGDQWVSLKSILDEIGLFLGYVGVCYNVNVHVNVRVRVRVCKGRCPC